MLSRPIALVLVSAAALSVAALLIFLAYSQPASAASITVNEQLDDNPAINNGFCSLREAISAANTDAAVDACPAGSGADTINLPAGTYTLSIAGPGEDANATGDLDVTTDITINGAGAASTVIDGNGVDRVLDVRASLQITSATIRGGNVPATNGGGIIVLGGTLTLTNSTVSGNTATIHGGGISVSVGTLTLTNSTISGNSGLQGGGISQVGGTLNLDGSTVSRNMAGGVGFPGGGIYLEGSIATLTNSTISGNSNANFGGGINCAALGAPGSLVGSLTITNSTISGNEATGGFGGGIMDSSCVTVTLINTIVADQLSGGDCFSQTGITSLGHNLDSDDTCDLTDPPDLPNATAMLGPLQNNGGPTETHALLAGSPAIDAGDGSACPVTDQRGIARPQGAECDIGSFELAGAPTGTPSPSPTATATPTPTPTPSPTPTPTPTPTPSPTVEGETETPIATQTPTASATPTPTGTPAPTDTPSPTGTAPAGQSVTWADNNCKDGVNPIDSLFVLRGDAGLPTDTGECPDMGANIEVLNASPHIWGDVDCGGAMTPVDSLKILRHNAGLSASQEAGCPAMASAVTITES